MTRILAILVVALSGCAVTYDRPPSNTDAIGPWMGPHNDEVERVEALRVKLLPALYVARPASEETPRVVKVDFGYARIYARACYSMAREAVTVQTTDYTWDIFLCGLPLAYTHEFKGHVEEKLKHGPWLETGGGKCAQITDAGTTGYRLGDTLCTANGVEWVDRP